MVLERNGYGVREKWLWCSRVTVMVFGPREATKIRSALHWCYHGVTMMSLWCYNGVTMVFHCCFTVVSLLLMV
jgi:hypothetical protein